MVHGANIVTLSEETESNRENKPAPKVTKAHIYSTRILVHHKNGQILGVLKGSQEKWYLLRIPRSPHSENKII